MTLRILSTEKIIFSGAAARVTLPGAGGPFTVLDKHAPLISTLIPGEIAFITEQGEEKRVKVTGGIAEVRDNWVYVCID